MEPAVAERLRDLWLELPMHPNALGAIDYGPQDVLLIHCVSDHLGDLAPDQLKQADVDSFARAELERGMTVKTVNNRLSVLSSLNQVRDRREVTADHAERDRGRLRQECLCSSCAVNPAIAS